MDISKIFPVKKNTMRVSQPKQGGRVNPRLSYGKEWNGKRMGIIIASPGISMRALAHIVLPGMSFRASDH